jgi:hypothetical protein
MSSGLLTDEERERIGALLIDSHQRFLDSIRGLTPGQWAFKPGEDVWSVAECCDHVGGAERLFLAMVRRGLIESPERAEAVQGKQKIVLKAVSNRQVRVKVPVPIAAYGNVSSPEEFEPAFTATHEKTLEYVRTTQDPLHLRVREHFMLGDFDGAQWLELIAAHRLRHRNQIEEIKTLPGYPG